MSAEFTKLGPDTTRSAQGFTVVFHPQGGVDYTDGGSKTRVDTELYVTPSRRHVLYANSQALRGLSSSQAAQILANIKRAMEFLGHPTEII
jgi:hypothetical protein